MKNKILKTVFGAALFAVAGYGVYINQTKKTLSDVMLANLEALGRYESSEVEIVCNQNDYTSPGQCWEDDGGCYILMQWYNQCRFCGYQAARCTSVCNLWFD